MPTAKEIYNQYGDICLLCANFKPEKASAGMEDKIMKVIAATSDDVAEAEMKDQRAIYGHCEIGKQGVMAGVTCSTTLDGMKQFSFNYDGWRSE
ncbi:MAG: hypothetical protein U1C50_01940 [Patescibacteria group bacterium]|nr:hypothetical protein [Candidatus Beckwithbacteria bacterium]MDZ4228996.1 hypothetical protein [Patescibacteria group bacterium]